MRRKKSLTADTTDGMHVRDHNSYAKHDMLLSDKLQWLLPNVPPTRCYNLPLENSPAKFTGLEYFVTRAPAAPEYNPATITAMGKVWNDGINGRAVTGGRLGESTKLQMLVAAFGLGAFALVLTVWLVLSQTQELPPLPITPIQESGIESVN